MRQRPSPLRPDRIRTIERPFGWMPFRVLRSGLLGRLSPSAKLLYFFLSLVADRHGLSFYGPKRIIELLGFDPSQLVDAVAELRHEDVLAFDGEVYQLLSLPPWLGQVPNDGPKTQAAVSRPEPSVQPRPQHLDQLLGDIVEEG